jgi:hypothetical protein
MAMERLDRHFENLAAASFARYGFAYGELLARWPEIAGTETACLCSPQRIKWPRGGGDDKRKLAGTIVLRAEPGCGLEVQHLVPLILERVNQFYGFGAISAAVVQQGSSHSGNLLRKKGNSLDPKLEKAIDERTDQVADVELRAALRRLGAGVMSARRTSPQGE